MGNNTDINRLMNLIRFSVNFSKYADINLLHSSPDYILEKYYHWIGFEPVTDIGYYTPDSCTDFFLKYAKIWGDTSKVRRQLLYLLQVEKKLNILEMVEMAEKYFGPANLISNESKRGLHELVETRFINLVLEKNGDNLKVALRDLKINTIIK